MAHWRNKIDISEEYKLYRDNKATTQEVGQMVAEKLLKLRKAKLGLIGDEDLEDIILRFQYECESIEDFDDVLEALYDWGDYDHTCWITT